MCEFEEQVILLCAYTIKMFFENHVIQCYLKSLHKDFSTDEHNKTETYSKQIHHARKANCVVKLNINEFTRR